MHAILRASYQLPDKLPMGFTHLTLAWPVCPPPSSSSGLAWCEWPTVQSVGTARDSQRREEGGGGDRKTTCISEGRGLLEAGLLLTLPIGYSTSLGNAYSRGAQTEGKACCSPQTSNEMMSEYKWEGYMISNPTDSTLERSSLVD